MSFTAAPTATAVRSVETLSPTHPRMRLAGLAGLAATVRDLTARADPVSRRQSGAA